MTQLALWLGLATIALAVVTFAHFALRARRLNVHTFHLRGHLATAGGIGVLGLGLVLIALHGARTPGPDGISWLGVSVMALGASLWGVGEFWERRAKKSLDALQRVAAVAEEAKARTKFDGEESTTGS